ncbi:MAG: hypothetical protein COY22_00155 [Candidatus Tagabacteria bacterium CG_4_10_14_0_2_um_filter_40_13]|nr:MAG: hypothetical protein COY22_00155 [Candidatus Tagabacteria bacterium CG_4_10_14_0_2_um_filter_40_13]
MADQGKNLINQTDKLLAEIKKANSDFDKKTSKIIFDAQKTSKELDKMRLDEELEKIEKEGVRKMDKTVLEYLSSD